MSDFAAHDPGGKRSFPLPYGVVGDATYGGPDDCYRYLAEYLKMPSGRTTLRTLMVVGMNPSTATELVFDPTVAKLWRLAQRWGFDRLIMTNTYAYRATHQMRLLEVENPIGPDNDWYLYNGALRASLLLMAYGTPHHRSLHDRGPAVAEMLRARGHKLHVLKLSKDGRPYHPLYLPDSLVPVPWNG